MPRKAAARTFGFRRAGLVRILLAADPLEILMALEDLGLAIPDKPKLNLLLFEIAFSLLPGPSGKIFRWSRRSSSRMRGARAVMMAIRSHRFHPTAHGPKLDALLAAASNAQNGLTASIRDEPKHDPAVALEFEARIKKAVDEVLPPPKATI